MNKHIYTALAKSNNDAIERKLQAIYAKVRFLNAAHRILNKGADNDR